MEKRTATAVAVIMLVLSCSVMMVAWYGHLRFSKWPVWQAILISWGVALAEYALQVPANRIGHEYAGMSAADLRAIAEVAILTAFLAFSTLVLKDPLRVNHLVGFFLVCAGVAVVLKGPFDAVIVNLGDGNEKSSDLTSAPNVAV